MRQPLILNIIEFNASIYKTHINTHIYMIIYISLYINNILIYYHKKLLNSSGFIAISVGKECGANVKHKHKHWLD